MADNLNELREKYKINQENSCVSLQWLDRGCFYDPPYTLTRSTILLMKLTLLKIE